MPKAPFKNRVETFGLDTEQSWAMDALRLLFHVPRAYQPLVEAWDERHPGTKRALERLKAMNFVAWQGPVVVDTRTAENAEKSTRAVRRFRTTSKGRRLVEEMSSDIRVLEDLFPHIKPSNVKGVAKLLQAFDLDDSHAKYGLSVGHATEISGLPERNGRWWVEKLVGCGMLRQLPQRLADTREVVPAHWRVTRQLRNQLKEVLEEFDREGAESLRVEFRLSRSRFLQDIDPARLGISGATDFDHDIECQKVLGALLRSQRCAVDGIFTVEPRINLPMSMQEKPWAFNKTGKDNLFYQPDAELREKDPETNKVNRSVIEYERYQTRRDAWNHIERFIGYLYTMTLPFEGAVLRFVVDSDARVRSYVQLIEAFVDYAMDNPERMPPNKVILAVSSVPKVLGASDPLDPKAWHRIALPGRNDPLKGADTAFEKSISEEKTQQSPVLHDPAQSPYDEYFGRG